MKRVQRSQEFATGLLVHQQEHRQFDSRRGNGENSEGDATGCEPI